MVHGTWTMWIYWPMIRCYVKPNVISRGPGSAWLITELNESQSKVQKVPAYYTYSVVQFLVPGSVYEEAVVYRIVSGDATYYRGISTKSGLLIELFGKVGSRPSKLRFIGSMIELVDLRGCDYNPY